MVHVGNDAKKWYLSKTIWANVVAFVIAMVVAATDTDLVKQYPQLVAYFAAAVTVLNAVLRVITEQAISLFSDRPPPRTKW